MRTESRLKPYRVRPSDVPLDALLAEVNEQLYMNYACDYTSGGGGKIVTGALADFERLLEGLASIPHVEFVPHRAMATTPCPTDRLRIGFRHDIDGDIVAALAQAELQQRYGVRATWYVLHTAPYYGVFEGGAFRRHECMAPVYRRLQALGHEVGLHTDPLGVCQFHGMDGAAAVREEIAWLRSIGIELDGTVAHNSKPVYGAWNYEIFRGRRDPKDARDDAELPTEVVHDGRWAPLRVLDEAELGLRYEGNEVLWQAHTPLEYGATRAANLWRWQAHRPGRDGSPDRVFLDQERMLAAIRDLEPGRFVVLVVHPCYYGARAVPRRRPVHVARRSAVRSDERLGWFTWDPQVIQCFGTRRRDGGPGRQAIHRPNEHGMLDRPWPAPQEIHAHRRILVLGAENVDGATVPGPRHLTAHLEALLEEHDDVRACVRKLAHPGMGASRLASWLSTLGPGFAPDWVVIGIGGNIVLRNLPWVFCSELGVSAQEPPGAYLDLPETGDGAIVEVARSRAWRRHRTTPRLPLRHPRCAEPLRRILATSDEAARVGRHTVLPLLEAVYGALVERVRALGARPLLLVEDLDESLGLSAAAGPDADDLRASIRSRLESIACAAGCPIVDPYERLASSALPWRHDDDARWNGTGHRIVAEVLHEHLRADQDPEAGAAIR